MRARPETAELSLAEAAQAEADGANHSQHSSEKQSKLARAFILPHRVDVTVL